MTIINRNMIKKNNILLTQEFVPVNILNISIAFGQIERTKKLVPNASKNHELPILRL